MLPKFAVVFGGSTGTGGGASENIGFTKKYYNGSVENINTLDILGKSRSIEVAGAFGGGLSVEYDMAVDDNENSTWNSFGVNLEIGVRGSPVTLVDIQGGVN